jgi:hypothetical protein
MMKSTYVIAALLIAAAIVTLLSLSPQVEAYSPVPGAKADRLDARPDSMCARQEWPYYETGCLRDAKYLDGKARAVRTVSTDR